MRTNNQNIRELVKRGESYLSDKGVPNARRNAEWMLSEVLGCRSAELYLRAEATPRPSDIATYVGHLERRGAREPLQYVLGSTEFMSLPFWSLPGVFIPRPDTEILIEVVESRLATRTARRRRGVLDLCCGSGVVGISLARRLADVTVAAVDVSPDAVALTERNARLNGIGRRLDCECAGALDYLSATAKRFDAIVSNPPYVPSGEMAKLAPEIRLFEPPLSLDGGEDGLDFYRTVIPRLARSLEPGGFVAFEMGASQGEAVSQLLQRARFENIEVTRDYGGLDRVIVGEITP